MKKIKIFGIFLSLFTSIIVARLRVENKKGAIFNAVRQNDLLQHLEEIVQKDRSLLDARDEQERTPLHWAALNARPNQVEFLLNAGADPNVQDFQGNTPMHLAAKFMVDPINRKKVLSDLLLHNADINIRNKNNSSVIDIAESFDFRLFISRCSLRRKAIRSREGI